MSIVASFQAIAQLIASPLEDEVADDLSGEQETLQGDEGADDDDEGSEDALGSPFDGTSPTVERNSQTFLDISDYQTRLLAVSKAVTERTAYEYEIQMAKFVKFLIDQGLVKNGDQVFCPTPHKDMGWWIALWICAHCDVVDLDGRPIPKEKQVPTYAHAQKMRAAMTYAFGRLQRLGSTPWHESPTTPGRMMGNPSVSEIVSSYMVSLKRRKVQAGEIAISSRAITPDILLKMYNFNNDQGRSTIHGFQRNARKDAWCGPRTRLMLQAAYTIAFACLLRFDEVLRIQISDIVLLEDENGSKTIAQLTLRSRKTSQFGGIKPFYIHSLPAHEAHLCPFRALCYWISASKITYGYLFRAITKADQVSRSDKPMTRTKFNDLFRKNLLDVNIDPAPYGTHSVRRGGVQYLLLYKRAGIRQICEWGGWSTDFNSTSVLRYIISISDDVQLSREDFLNPNRVPHLKCYVCGRNCPCS